MRTAILICYHENYKPLAQITLPNIGSYCEKHKYEFITICNPQPFQSDSGYNKIREIQRLFDESGIGLLLSMDLDMMVTNFNIMVEDFVGSHDFYLCRDINGINCGSFIIKKTNWSKDYLADILDLQGEVPNEQQAIEKIGIMIGDKKIKILPHPSINSIKYDEYKNENYGQIVGVRTEAPTHEQGNWQEGDFICHLPGKPINDRIEIFKNIKIQK